MSSERALCALDPNREWIRGTCASPDPVKHGISIHAADDLCVAPPRRRLADESLRWRRFKSCNTMDGTLPELPERFHAPALVDEADLDLDLDSDFIESLDETAWNMLDRSVDESVRYDTAASDVSKPNSSTGFQKANGQRLARPSAAAMEHAAKRLRLDEADSLESLNSLAPPSGAPLALSPPASAPFRSPLRTLTPVHRPATYTPQHGTFLPKPAPTGSPVGSALRAGEKYMSPIAARGAPTPRTPGPRAGPSRSLGVSPGTPRPSSTLGTPRRPIALGLSRPRTATPRTFTPPFKRGAAAAPPNAALPAAKTEPSLFDLRPRVRTSYRAAGIVPRQQTEADALARGVPYEAVLILRNPTYAAQYAFGGRDGVTQGAAEALAALHALGAARATLRWVQNHWALVLWKLAAYVATDAQRGATWWTWDNVLAQLRYRYEREMHEKKHSAVKQIQEQSASASRPLVLCVQQVLRFDDTDEDSAIMLQLTDGWYRIRAELDTPLRRAVERGALRVGHKLGIMAARIRAAGEGTHVLDGLYTSDLAITANSTALVPWDTRLGFQRSGGFVSSLGKLVPDGGIVGLMDIVVDRLYPVGFVEGFSDARGVPDFHGPEYAEDEERERSAAWEVSRVQARSLLTALAQRLERAAAWLEARFVATDEPWRGAWCFAASFDTDLTAWIATLEATDDPVSTLSARLAASLPFGALLTAVRARLAVLAQPESDAYTDELDRVCPPRRVRSFRIVRFHDARPTARACARTVQLTVWHAPPLAVGQRYEVGGGVLY